MKYTHVIWDWNGTLFDDVDWCVKVMAQMLAAHDIAPMDLKKYRAVFGFPISDYYQKIGYDFNKIPFDVLSREFIARYHENDTGGSPLQFGVEAILAVIREKGISQVVLSASRTDNLMAQVARFDILEYFDEVVGISDIHAASKLEAGRAYMRRAKPEKALFIGDTLHDFEVATALGADCMLFSGGHQSRERLERCGVPVLDVLAEVIEYL